MQVTLLPAYGRKFNTVDEMLQAWKDGKDFHIYNGPYCSIRDIECMQHQYGITSVVLMYKHLSHTINF